MMLHTNVLKRQHNSIYGCIFYLSAAPGKTAKGRGLVPAEAAHGLCSARSGWRQVLDGVTARAGGNRHLRPVNSPPPVPFLIAELVYADRYAPVPPDPYGVHRLN